MYDPTQIHRIKATAKHSLSHVVWIKLGRHSETSESHMEKKREQQQNMFMLRRQITSLDEAAVKPGRMFED